MGVTYDSFLLGVAKAYFQNCITTPVNYIVVVRGKEGDLKGTMG